MEKDKDIVYAKVGVGMSFSSKRELIEIMNGADIITDPKNEYQQIRENDTDKAKK